MTDSRVVFDGAILIASDSDAKYELLETHQTRDGNLTCLSYRNGKLESGFSLREIRLADGAFRYIGEGETFLQLAENISFLERRKKVTEREFSMTENDSISDVIVKTAISVFKEMKSMGANQ